MFSYIWVCFLAMLKHAFGGAGVAFQNVAMLLEHYVNQVTFAIDLKAQVKQSRLRAQYGVVPPPIRVIHEPRAEETPPEEMN